MTLIEMAERVERASWADREIDKAIWAALGNCNHERTKYYCIEDGNDTDSGFTCLDCGKDIYGANMAPAFTASIDAAATLVLEGWRWGVTTTGFKPGASIVSPRGTFAGGGGAYAATPALALVAASLRARATQENG